MLGVDYPKDYYTIQEVTSALSKADYKYWGDYEFSDEQWEAYWAIEWAAKEYLKLKAGEPNAYR